MFWKRSFKRKIERVNCVFSNTIEKLRNIQVDMTAQIDKNQTKIQKLTDDNIELKSLKDKASYQTIEISKLLE